MEREQVWGETLGGGAVSSSCPGWSPMVPKIKQRRENVRKGFGGRDVRTEMKGRRAGRMRLK